MYTIFTDLTEICIKSVLLRNSAMFGRDGCILLSMDLSYREFSSVPSTYIVRLTAVCNSSPAVEWGSITLFWTPKTYSFTLAHTHTSTHTYVEITGQFACNPAS